MVGKMQLLKKNPVIIVGLITYSVLFGILLSVGIIDEPDSPGYIDAIINRPPLYPLLIDLFQFIFGANFKTPLLFVQLLLGLLASLFFIKTISKLFPVNPWVLFGLSLIIVAPYFLYLRLGNMILSEGLAYPLFVFFISYLFRGFFLDRRKDFYISAAILFVLSLTRGQFLYVFPVAVLMFIYLSIRHKAFKKYMLLLVIFLAIPFVSNLLDKTYHKIYFGHFVSTPWTGLHVSALPFFLSDEEDYLVFESTDEQQYFKHVYRELTMAGLTLKEFNKTNTGSRGFWFYALNSTTIANGIIDGKGTHFFDEEDLDTKFILNDRMGKKMAIPLIINNFNIWIKFYIMNIIAGIGHEKFLFLYPIILLFSFYYLITRRYQRLDMFIFVCFLLALANVALIAFNQPLTIYRYTIYGDFLIYSSIIILFSQRVFIPDKP